MFRSTTLATLLVALTASLTVCAAIRTPTSPPPVRVGVYDSRAIAIAYSHSEFMAKALSDLKKERDDAKAANDAAGVAAAEKKGAALQSRFHQQGFSTASVSNLLKPIAAELPKIAEAAQVELLVSKWDLSWQKAGVTFVDVTKEMCEPFHPDATVQKMIQDIPNHEPLPLYETNWEQVDQH